MHLLDILSRFGKQTCQIKRSFARVSRANLSAQLENKILCDATSRALFYLRSFLTPQLQKPEIYFPVKLSVRFLICENDENSSRFCGCLLPREGGNFQPVLQIFFKYFPVSNVVEKCLNSVRRSVCMYICSHYNFRKYAWDCYEI